MVSPRHSDVKKTNKINRRAVLLGAICLAACESQDPRVLSNDRVGLPAARNAPAPETPDGLEVGHRLMDAGEYELALKAYHLAASEQGFTVDVLSAIGSANLRLERLGQAERLLRAALRLDEEFVPALNNLGVVLNAKNEIGEAREVFRIAFALDSGQSDDIRDNLRLLNARLENIDTPTTETEDFRLVRRGNGQYLLLGQ